MIGNPPYVRIQGFPRVQIEYLTKKYQSAKGNCDVYVSFVEQGYNLLKSDGRLGNIVPNKFFKTDYGEGLRPLLSSNKGLTEIVDFGANQVFEATTYTCLLFLTKRSNRSFRYAEAIAKPEALVEPKFVERESNTLDESAWTFAGEEIAAIIRKLSSQDDKAVGSSRRHEPRK